MQNIRKMSALLGASAVILGLAGCADKNGNGQAESPAPAGQVGNAVADNLGDTANAAAGGAKTVGNAVAGAGSAMGNAAAGGAAAVGNVAAGGAAAAGNVAAGAGKMAAGAGKMAAGAAGAVAGAGAALTLTPKIKAALINNPAMKGLQPNVDTIAGSKTIRLSGTVKTAAQKTLASKIAQQGAAGYKIQNDLKVGK